MHAAAAVHPASAVPHASAAPGANVNKQAVVELCGCRSRPVHLHGFGRRRREAQERSDRDASHEGSDASHRIPPPTASVKMLGLV